MPGSTAVDFVPLKITLNKIDMSGKQFGRSADFQTWVQTSWFLCECPVWVEKPPSEAHLLPDKVFLTMGKAGGMWAVLG